MVWKQRKPLTSGLQVVPQLFAIFVVVANMDYHEISRFFFLLEFGCKSNASVHKQTLITTHYLRIPGAVASRAEGSFQSRALARAAEATSAGNGQQLVGGGAAGGVRQVVGKAEGCFIEFHCT